MLNGNSPVVVHRSGFLAALAYGLAAIIIAGIFCLTAVGFYSMNIIDRKVSEVFGAGEGLVEALPHLQEALPPVLAEALNDRRNPAYRDQIEVRVRLTDDADVRGQRMAALEVVNNGSETITMLPVRVVLSAPDGTPVRAVMTYVATPLAIDDEWRGPLLPGQVRRCAVRVWSAPANCTPSAEIVDLRIWKGEPPERTAEAMQTGRPTVPPAPPMVEDWAATLQKSH